MEKGLLLMIDFDKEAKQDSRVFLICLMPFSLQTSSMIFRILGKTAISAVGKK